jgi:PHD/YefM family antitoxin component YafN of YafNO toxin-antitoxin module
MSIEYITDEDGKKKAAIVPIKEWNKISEIVERYTRSVEETDHLLQSDAMRKRLQEAMADDSDVSLDEVKHALGL